MIGHNESVVRIKTYMQHNNQISASQQDITYTSNASTTVTPKEGSLGIPLEAVVGSTAGAAGANFSAPLLFHVKI